MFQSEMKTVLATVGMQPVIIIINYDYYHIALYKMNCILLYMYIVFLYSTELIGYWSLNNYYYNIMLLPCF